MYKIKSKLDKNRSNLSEVLPLSTPYVIQIDPSSKCNFKCKFCPTSKEDKARSIMDYDLFKNIIDGCKEFDKKIKTIKLWKDGEPLLNPKLPEMIKYIKENEAAEKVELTTNGYLLNEQLNYKLIESGLDKIIISIEGLCEEDYLKNSRVKINFDKFIRSIKHFYENRKGCIVHIKIIDVDLTEFQKNEFFGLFNTISDELFIEKAIPCWPDFEDESISEGHLNVWGDEIEKKEVCPLPLYSVVINANGVVSMCCNDWQQKTKVGNVNDESIKEIWMGKRVKEFQILQLSKRRKTVDVCSKCMYPDYVAIDNMDNYALMILDKYKNM